MDRFDYQRVLIILPERLGDALFHTPSIQLLRTMRPDIRIGVLALSPLTAGMLANNPALDAIHLAADKTATQALAPHYDVILKLHDHSEARKYAAWLGLPVLTYTYVPTDLHRSQRSLYMIRDLLGCAVPNDIGRYRLYPAPANFDAVATLLREQHYDADRDILIGCHLGCHSIAKRSFSFWRPLAHPKVWPLENFAALDAALRARDTAFRLVLTGSKQEQKLAARLRRQTPSAIDLVDRTSVLDLAALTRHLALFVSSDTGALHVACAGDIGIVALFGPTSTTLTGPWPPSDKQRVLQADCIEAISVQQVLDTILDHPAIVAAQNRIAADA